MSNPELLLDNQICFLVYRLHRAIGAKYRPLLDVLGLTYPQYLVMLALWEHRTLAIGELCRLLDLETGTVSPLIKRMESVGFVERVRKSDDERSVSVCLTKKGSALEKKALAVPGSVAACLFSDIEEYNRLKSELKELIGRLDDDNHL